MVAGLDETLIDQEIRRIFRPSAQRMLEAAKTFVQAWREMQSVEGVLLQRVRLSHTRVTGDACTRYDHELIGRARDGELLPTLIEGLPFEELRDLNDQFTRTDSELVTALACRPSCAWTFEGCHHGDPAFTSASARSFLAAVAAHCTGVRRSGAPASPTAAFATGSTRRHLA